MYAVVSSGGKQYRVEPGSTLTMERLPAESGTSVTFDRVLLVGDGETVTIGTPVVSGASVSGTVLGEVLGPKIIIFKFKQKVKYRRRTGHRQHLVTVRIDGITADGKTTSAPESEKPAKAPRVRKPKAAAAASAAKAARPKPARKPAPKRSASSPKTSPSAKSGSTRSASTTSGAAKKAAAGDTDAPAAKAAPRRRKTAAPKSDPKE